MTGNPIELGTEKVSTLLGRYAVPAIIAMTASSLYSIVDSIFIGHGVGPLAISGLGVCLPIINLSTAFGTLVGVGASTMISILLGKKEYDGARKVLGNIVSLNTIIGALFAVVCLIFLEPLLVFFGATDQTMSYASEYLEIILWGNVVTHLYFGLNAAMRSSGYPRFAMWLTLFTVVLNAILDPLFIFTFDMGIAGAAWATVLSQAVSLVVILYEFSNRKRMLHFDKGVFRFTWSIASDSLAIGTGPFLLHSAACIVNLFVNNQLLRYIGDLGIGACGILYRISYLFVMIVMGLTQGMQPIAGYNFGARKYSRVRQVYKLSVIWASVVTTIGFLASELTPELLCGMFTSDSELMAISVNAIRKANVVFPIIGFQIVSANLFQSLGMVRKSILLSIIRQLIILAPCFYILPLFLGADGIWYSYPMSDGLSSIITFILIASLFRKFDKLEDGDDPAILGGRI